MKKSLFVIAAGLLAASIAVLPALGCGSTASNTTTVSAACAAAPSLIPPNDGKPQLIDFYRDT